VLTTVCKAVLSTVLSVLKQQKNNVKQQLT
jgi:hypothetical protein